MEKKEQVLVGKLVKEVGKYIELSKKTVIIMNSVEDEDEIVEKIEDVFEEMVKTNFKVGRIVAKLRTDYKYGDKRLGKIVTDVVQNYNVEIPEDYYEQED